MNNVIAIRKAGEQVLEALCPLSYSDACYVLEHTMLNLREDKRTFEGKVSLKEILSRSREE